MPYICIEKYKEEFPFLREQKVEAFHIAFDYDSIFASLLKQGKSVEEVTEDLEILVKNALRTGQLLHDDPASFKRYVEEL